MSEPVKKLSLIDRLLLLVSNIIPFHGIGPIGVISLITRRIVMQNVNLYNAPLENDASSSETSVPDHRTADGAGNDKQYFSTGSSNTAFGRNMPPNARRAHAEQPPVQVVAAKLLQRDTYHPAGDQFNVLAAAWIQAQVSYIHVHIIHMTIFFYLSIAHFSQSDIRTLGP